ncbi:hypothetical protein LIOPPNJA_28645, partial [Robbsia andropogonis]|nr:hypothetical protein [Robbsia andropogonis]MCP1131679.1 hypothetical protein [Robbsia andropogonis]
IEELLLERGVIVSYESIRRWCDKFGSRFAAQVKITGAIAKTWHLGEMFVRGGCGQNLGLTGGSSCIRMKTACERFG